jgi:outer membrane biosynthesis protein TonB
LEAQPKPRPAETPGDLALRRPEPRKVESDGTSESPAHTRPRNLQEARARRNLLVGERMKQPGGVRNVGRVAVDVKATAFGAYDAAFIAAVQDRWYNILDAYPYSLRSGKVVVKFKLMHDGSIRQLTVGEESVGELQSLFCQRAIMEPAPYAPWPSDMRRIIGDPHRDVTFTFYYN